MRGALPSASCPACWFESFPDSLGSEVCHGRMGNSSIHSSPHELRARVKKEHAGHEGIVYRTLYSFR